jgi:hypothetical protein
LLLQRPACFQSWHFPNFIQSILPWFSIHYKLQGKYRLDLGFLFIPEYVIRTNPARSCGSWDGRVLIIAVDYLGYSQDQSLWLAI